MIRTKNFYLMSVQYIQRPPALICVCWIMHFKLVQWNNLHDQCDPGQGIKPHQLTVPRYTKMYRNTEKRIKLKMAK